MKEMSATHN